MRHIRAALLQPAMNSVFTQIRKDKGRKMESKFARSTALLLGLLMPVVAGAQDDEPPSPFERGFYAAPMGSYFKPDSSRNLDDGAGLQLGLGYRFGGLKDGPFVEPDRRPLPPNALRTSMIAVPAGDCAGPVEDVDVAMTLQTRRNDQLTALLGKESAGELLAQAIEQAQA